MFENLRKNLNSPARDSAEAEKITEKVDPFKLPSANVIKEAAEKAQVETAPAKTVEIAETAPETENTQKASKTSAFDGIIYNGGSTQPKPKPNKKYNSYRNDTPLFFFDSFEEDDEEFTADDKKTEAEVVLTAPEVTEVEEAEEVAEVEEAEDVAEVEEAEEIAEVEAEMEKGNAADMEKEFGDLLFSLVNASRLYGINPDNALEQTNNKFRSRFNYVEQNTIKQGRGLREMSLEEMDALWNEAKKQGL
jgi:NTP pyrophosphatase (non-canonical NTP hydrolase)